MKKTVRLMAAVFAGCAILTSCVSSAEFDKLKQRVDSMESQLVQQGLIKADVTKREKTPNPNKKQKEDEYEVVDFYKIFRNIEENKDKKFQFEGTIIRNLEYSSSVEKVVELMLDGGNAGDSLRINGTYVMGDLPESLLPNDWITVYGTLTNAVAIQNTSTYWVDMTLDYIQYNGQIYNVSSPAN